MYCRYCGEVIDDNEVYCPNCGELVWEPDLDKAHAGGKRKLSRRGRWIVSLIIIATIIVLAAGICCFVLYSQNGDGTLVINTTPAEADVYLDGVYCGASPLVIPVTPSATHTLKVLADGYETWEQTISVKANEVQVITPTLSGLSTESYTRTYYWDYNGLPFTLTLDLPKDQYNKYKELGHMTNNLTKYATDSYNREITSKIAAHLTDEANAHGFDAYDRMMLAASFVQNFIYTTDEDSTGKVEYARYPIETLVDGVADCEDSSVLLASILKDMGYDVIIVKFDGHVALGVALDGYEISGAYVEKDGKKYYYLETVSPGWELGEITDKYLDSSIKVFPVN